jgi:hypothetical protein
MLRLPTPTINNKIEAYWILIDDLIGTTSLATQALLKQQSSGSWLRSSRAQAPGSEATELRLSSGSWLRSSRAQAPGSEAAELRLLASLASQALLLLSPFYRHERQKAKK